VRSLLAECQATKVTLDKEVLAYACKTGVDRLSERLLATPSDEEVLKHFIQAAKLAHDLPFGINLWKPQNAYYEISRVLRPELARTVEKGDAAAKRLDSLYAELGKALGFSSSVRFDPTNQIASPPAAPAEPALANAG
jgi:hypothetical protein